ncbi:hypothetical protein W59_20773 [Rhodococcus opacus RKJ300 = JCM 13270]|uniref:Uncharacterized protein n=1 Tax=Rhodococcus opacus RKJ300 = JCM 13270 TaxID=1165867 RepID=I0WNS8_RHOOP|nr:hypothetical protein W59_20773 [Rhodococcus opacus RKJ300 = JCM 13270]
METGQFSFRRVVEVHSPVSGAPLHHRSAAYLWQTTADDCVRWWHCLGAEREGPPADVIVRDVRDEPCDLRRQPAALLTGQELERQQAQLLETRDELTWHRPVGVGTQSVLLLCGQKSPALLEVRGHAMMLPSAHPVHGPEAAPPTADRDVRPLPRRPIASRNVYRPTGSGPPEFGSERP